MRTIVAYMLVSLDGVAEDPEQFVLEWDDVLDDHLAKVIGTQTTVLLGRRMYDEWARFWPDSDIQPFADFINAVDKRVVTSTPLDVEWANARALDEDLAAEVGWLRDGEGGDVGVHGSIRLTASMIAAGLVDELRLVVAPRVVGTGRRLFDEGTPAQSWQLLSSTSTPTGALLLHYRCSRPSTASASGAS